MRIVHRAATAAAAADSAALFAALAAESRVRILQLLAADRLCVGALSRSTGISAGAVSQHLRILRSAGLVAPERRGYFIHYRLAPGAGRKLRTALADVVSPNGQKQTCRLSSRCLPAGKKTARSTSKKSGKESIMCCESKCQKPENLKGKPEDCTSEQIRKCHGDEARHPCQDEPKRK